MTTISRKRTADLRECPHCSSNLLVWDGSEREIYCFICGWRPARRITSSQARDHFRKEHDFWLNLFAMEEYPDDYQESADRQLPAH